MSIASAITAAQSKVAACYTAISNKGGTLPATRNLSSMPTAIGSIPSISPNTKYGCTIDNLLGNIDAYGILQLPINTSDGITFTNVEDIVDYGLYYKFFNNDITSSVSFPDLVGVSGLYGCSATVRGCTSLTSASLPKLATVSGNNGCSYMFYGCTGLTSISFPELTVLSGNNCFEYCFCNCTNLTSISFPELITISGEYAFKYTFKNCTSLATISFPKLTNLSDSTSGFNNCFYGCTNLSSVSFPALTTQSFGTNTDVFNTMLASTGSTTTHIIHFPRNLQTTISSLTGYATFGGTTGKVTLAFDLPATS